MFKGYSVNFSKPDLKDNGTQKAAILDSDLLQVKTIWARNPLQKIQD